jgi:hypothetical protein
MVRPKGRKTVEQNLLSPAIVQLRGTAIGMASDSLGRLQSAVIFQKIRDADRKECGE